MVRGSIAVLAWLLATGASAQAPYHPPRLSDGHPDFDGVWMNPPRGSQLEKGPFGEALVVSAQEAKAMGEAYTARTHSAAVFVTQADLPDKFELAVVGGEHRTRLLVAPADGMLPYTPSARAKVDAWYAKYVATRNGGPSDDPEDGDLSLRCITVEGQPPMRVATPGSLRQIVQGSEAIAIYSEYVNEVRIVRMGGAFEPAAMRSLWGDSVGRWEGEVLVVETRNFRLDNPFHVVIGEKPVMVGPDSRMIERFRRVSKDELNYTFTVLDPSIYAGPWLAEYAMTRSNERPLETSCHEGNTAVTNILQGARYEEDAKRREAR